MHPNSIRFIFASPMKLELFFPPVHCKKNTLMQNSIDFIFLSERLNNNWIALYVNPLCNKYGRLGQTLTQLSARGKEYDIDDNLEKRRIAESIKMIDIVEAIWFL